MCRPSHSVPSTASSSRCQSLSSHRNLCQTPRAGFTKPQTKNTSKHQLLRTNTTQTVILYDLDCSVYPLHLSLLNSPTHCMLPGRCCLKWSMTRVFWCRQKEEDGEILNALGRPETTFEQSGLGPGQEYEVKLEVVKNNKRGPPASRNIVTSEWSAFTAAKQPLSSFFPPLSTLVLFQTIFNPAFCNVQCYNVLFL